jgi:hypothetical protein
VALVQAAKDRGEIRAGSTVLRWYFRESNRLETRLVSERDLLPFDARQGAVRVLGTDLLHRGDDDPVADLQTQ